MRHDIPFPIHNDYEICHYLKNIWECGWLDEYSDESCQKIRKRDSLANYR